jgi:hypothetical protein
MKKCYLCRTRPAAVPDRNQWTGGKFIKQICKECHASRLRGDLINVVGVHNKKCSEQAADL